MLLLSDYITLFKLYRKSLDEKTKAKDKPQKHKSTKAQKSQEK